MIFLNMYVCMCSVCVCFAYNGSVLVSCDGRCVVGITGTELHVIIDSVS